MQAYEHLKLFSQNRNNWTKFNQRQDEEWNNLVNMIMLPNNVHKDKVAI